MLLLVRNSWFFTNKTWITQKPKGYVLWYIPFKLSAIYVVLYQTRTPSDALPCMGDFDAGAVVGVCPLFETNQHCAQSLDLSSFISLIINILCVKCVVLLLVLVQISCSTCGTRAKWLSFQLSFRSSSWSSFTRIVRMKPLSDFFFETDVKDMGPDMVSFMGFIL